MLGVRYLFVVFFRNSEGFKLEVTFCVTNSRVAAVISLNVVTPLLTVLNARLVMHFLSLPDVCEPTAK